MAVAAKTKHEVEGMSSAIRDLSAYVPKGLGRLDNPQTAIPRLAKDSEAVREIERAVRSVPTSHWLYRGDGRDLSTIPSQSVHLVLTSPPYWTLKEYRDSAGQLGHVEDYDEFLGELDKVWVHCHRVLVPGGRLIVVLGAVGLCPGENGRKHIVELMQASLQTNYICYFVWPKPRN